MATATYDRITRSDLAGWDKESIDLVLEAQEFGWTGRVSSKGHTILRAPDGTTTMSVSRRWSNGRSGPNMRANLDRWLKGRTTEDVSFEQFSDAWDVAEQERFVSTMIDGLTRAANDFGSDDAERTKVIYRNILESPKVAPFAFRVGITESRIRDFGILIGYSDEITEENRRPWNVNWAVYDARSMEVVDFGGPRIIDGQPWDEEHITLLVVEKVRREREEEALAEPELDDEIADRPYVCEDCGRTFKRPVNLGRHRSVAHPDEPPAFKGDPMLDGLDDLMDEAVSVQMDDRLTIVVDPHDDQGNRLTPSEPITEAEVVANAMASAIDGLGMVATRMAVLESERLAFEDRMARERREYEEIITNLQSVIETLTEERNNAVGSLSALKALIAEA